MANDGWFKCDNCGQMKEVLVPDSTRTLCNKCSCGGTFKKT